MLKGYLIVIVTDIDVGAFLIVVYLIAAAHQVYLALQQDCDGLGLLVFTSHCLLDDFGVGTAIERVLADVVRDVLSCQNRFDKV